MLMIIGASTPVFQIEREITKNGAIHKHVIII